MQVGQVDLDTVIPNIGYKSRIQQEIHVAEQVDGEQDCDSHKDVPHVEIQQWAIDWEELPEDKAKKHKSWPTAEGQDAIGFDLLHKHFADVGATEDTQQTHIRALRRLFMLVSWEPPDTSHAWVLLGMHDQGIFGKLVRLPILDTSHSWSLKIATAMEYYIKVLLNANDSIGQTQRLSRLREVIAGALWDYKRSCYSSKAAIKREQRRLDIGMFKASIPVTAIKHAVKTAMIDLKKLHDECKAIQPLSHALRHAANTMIVFIIYMNGFAGKCKDWLALTMADVSESFALGRNYVTCKDAQHAKLYGEAGKGLAPGTITAIEHYLALPGKQTNLFLEPAKHGSPASIATCLRTASAVYAPSSFVLKVNWLRKLYHKEYLMFCEDDATAGLLKQMNPSGKTPTVNELCCQSPRRDAELGLMLFTRLFGEPMEWPTEAEISACTHQVVDIAKECSAVEANMANENGSATEQASDEDNDTSLHDAVHSHKKALRCALIHVNGECMLAKQPVRNDLEKETEPDVGPEKKRAKMSHASAAGTAKHEPHA